MSFRERRHLKYFAAAALFVSATIVAGLAAHLLVGRDTKSAQLHREKRGLNAKGGGQLEILIENDGEQVARAGVPLDITASVMANNDLTDLRYEWVLPSDVTALNGDVNGVIGTLPAGSEISLKLRLLPSSDENQLVHLHVYRVVGEERVGQMVEFNTVVDEQMAEALKMKTDVLGERDPASEDFKLMQ